MRFQRMISSSHALEAGALSRNRFPAHCPGAGDRLSASAPVAAPLPARALLYNWDMTTLGHTIEDDDIVLVVMAHDPLDPDTDQGSWIHDFISIDFINESGQYGYLDEEWEDTFHVDKPPFAGFEESDDFWPTVTAGNLWCNDEPEDDLHLDIDRKGQGELNCWITAIPCEWFEYQGAKLRIRDDINNWTHSDDLAPGDDIAVEITSPEEGTKYEYDDQVVFYAQINGNQLYAGLGSSIQWEILTPDYQSVVPEWEDWKGTMFTVAHIRDCWLTVKASLTVCGVEFSDQLTVIDPPRIEVDVESGPYWIDGPSIPIYPGAEAGWHTASLQTVEVKDWGTCGCGNVRHEMEPEPLYHDELCAGQGSEGLRPGQVQIKIDVDEEKCEGFYHHVTVRVYDVGFQEYYTLVTLYEPNLNMYRDTPFVWDLIACGEDCGQHTLLVQGWKVNPDWEGGYQPVLEDFAPVFLTVVQKADLVRIWEIYLGDKYGPTMGYHCCPHNPGLTGAPPRTGFIDCSGFVTQLLRRLARCDGADPPDCYELEDPLEHYGALRWRGEERAKIVTRDEIRNSLEELLHPGDILVWMGTDHVAIFDGWADKQDLEAYTVESWDEEETYGPLGHGPGENQRDLDDWNAEGRRWWVEGDQGAGVIVFRLCPQ